MIASNEMWVVPAGVDERRFFVVDVSTARQGDHAYFAAIEEQMQNGGLAAMLYDLLEFDLNGFEIRDVPNTPALTDSKLRTLRGPEAWLRDVLAEGTVDGTRLKYAESTTILKSCAFKDYRERATELGDPRASFNTFCRDLYAIGGRQIVCPIRPRWEDERLTCLSFAPLKHARQLFEAHVGGKIAWGDED